MSIRARPASWHALRNGAPAAGSRRCAWTLALLLAAALVGAQWLTLRHAHAGDGLAQECRVCAQAPAFAYGVVPQPPALARPAAAPPAVIPVAVPAGRRAPTPSARGPPAAVLH